VGGFDAHINLMISLAMDTAGTACAACLYDSSKQQVVAEISEEIGRGHAERLMGLVSDVMSKAKISYNDIGRIITTVGPGSFTGIRVGVATARGFGVGLGIPVVGVTNLEAMIAQAGNMCGAGQGKQIGVVMEAGRGQVYCQFTFETPLAESDTPFLASIDALAECLVDGPDTLVVCGSGADALAKLLANKPEIIDDLNTAPIGVVAHIGANRKQDDKRPEPLYLRKPDAKPQAGFAVARTR